MGKILGLLICILPEKLLCDPHELKRANACLLADLAVILQRRRWLIRGEGNHGGGIR